jgi:hypothetical protein
MHLSVRLAKLLDMAVSLPNLSSPEQAEIGSISFGVFETIYVLENGEYRPCIYAWYFQAALLQAFFELAPNLFRKRFTTLATVFRTAVRLHMCMIGQGC